MEAQNLGRKEARAQRDQRNLTRDDPTNYKKQLPGTAVLRVYTLNSIRVISRIVGVFKLFFVMIIDANPVIIQTFFTNTPL